ncbi:MAG: hypothetical protein NTX13_23285 [Acidobacteria bacterium]|nr:hypothetical protein [Acidobacteriota bacterium]
MRRAKRLPLVLLAAVTPLLAGPADRTVAEWTLLQGGRVGLNGSPRPLSDIAQLPAADFALTLLDWVAVNAVPEDLARLAGLTHLRELRLPGPLWNRNADGGKNLSQELRHLARLGTLQRITFSDHFLDRIRFTDDGLLAIGGLDNLRELALRQSEVTGKGLKPFHLLEALDITLCPVDDAGFAHLAAMKQLRRLRAGNTLISSNALASLAPLTLLEELDLSGTAIDDAAIPHLAPLTRLRRLDLASANITDAALETISRLPALEELNLYRTTVTTTGLARLRSLATLRDLDVRYSRATAAGVAALARPGLAIAFSAAPSLRAPAPPPRPDARPGDALPAWIRSLGGELSADQTRLSLRGTPINDATAAALAPLGPTLRHLDLSATEIGDAGLAVLARFPHLESLHLASTAVSSAGLAGLPRALKKLVLDNTYFEGTGLPPLPALVELDLLGAPVSDPGLAALAEAAPNLRRPHLAETAVSTAGPPAPPPPPPPSPTSNPSPSSPSSASAKPASPTKASRRSPPSAASKPSTSAAPASPTPASPTSPASTASPISTWSTPTSTTPASPSSPPPSPPSAISTSTAPTLPTPPPPPSPASPPSKASISITPSSPPPPSTNSNPLFPGAASSGTPTPAATTAAAHETPSSCPPPRRCPGRCPGRPL